MKTSSGIQSRRIDSEKSSEHEATAQFVAAGLITIAILIATTSITVGAAPHNDHRVQPYSIAGTERGRNVAPARDTRATNESAIIYTDEISRAMNASIDFVIGAAQPVWEAALWISRQGLSILAGSGLDPAVANNGALRGTRGDRAASVIALGLIGALLFGASGPLYYSWKMWRLGHLRKYR